jgi:cell division protein FtsI (penicillin-binding protein 3)
MSVNFSKVKSRRRLFMQRQAQAQWTEMLRRRSTVAFILATVIWSLILCRLFYYQVLKASEYKKIATRQAQLHIKLEAKRGIIYDRQGNELAINLPAESFFAVPESVSNVNLVTKTFFPFPDPKAIQMTKELTSRKKFVWLKRKVEKEEGDKLKETKLEGVWAKYETKRYYVYAGLAKDVLGFVDIDNCGLGGMEYQYDRLLKGQDGDGIFQRDGHQNYYQTTEFPIQKPVDGKSLVLTIDVELQSIVEQELKRGIEMTGADGGYALFMHPRTGEILAMAYCGKDDGLPIKNRVISDCFEPGSTFKLITAAAALEGKLYAPEDKIFAENGKFKVGSKIIHDVHPNGWLTFKECVMYSSNIALGKIALRVGKEKLYDCARSFGVGFKTGIDLPGEASGYIPSAKNRWPDVALANIGFGQGVSLTALQIVCAYSAVANGGVLMKPYVVKAVLDEKGDTLNAFTPVPVRRVVSENTANLLVDFLKGVVTSGSGKRAKVDGLEIGGKTGTAQKAKPGGGGYEENSYLASFIGFFPADDPQMIGLITLDSPKNAHLGGSTAAPVFKNAAQRIVALAGEDILTSVAKNVLSASKQKAPLALLEQKLQETEQKYLAQSGEPPALSRTMSDSTAGMDSQIPDVRGMTTREAVRILNQKDVKFVVRGSGIVVNQIFEADSSLVKDSSCMILECQPL